MQEIIHTGSTITPEDILNAKKSDEIISKALEEVTHKLNEFGNHIDKIIEKELLLKKTKNPMRRMVTAHQIKVLDEEGAELLRELKEAEKALLAVPHLDEHIECIAKFSREAANNIIRTVNTIKCENMKRRE